MLVDYEVASTGVLVASVQILKVVYCDTRQRRGCFS